MHPQGGLEEAAHARRQTERTPVGDCDRAVRPRLQVEEPLIRPDLALDEDATARVEDDRTHLGGEQRETVA